MVRIHPPQPFYFGIEPPTQKTKTMHHDHSHSHTHDHSHEHENEHGYNPLCNDSLADYFDRQAEKNMFAAFESHELFTLERMFHNWNLHFGHHILEPGCGQGRLTERLAHHIGPQGKIYACDLSGRMLQMAMSRMSNAGLFDRTELFHGSVLDMPLPTATADRALMFNVFPHFIDQPGVLALCARTLRNGGELWINQLRPHCEKHNFDRTAGPCHNENHGMPQAETMKSMLAHVGLKLVGLIEVQDFFYSLKAVKK